MFGNNPSVLVILPLTTKYVDWPSANWMVYGDHHGPCARYDTVSINKDSNPIGSFVFHPLEGGLLWHGNTSLQVITDNMLLYHNGELIAAVKTGGHKSFVIVLAAGVKVDWWGDFYLNKPNARTWQETVSQYQDELYV